MRDIIFRGKRLDNGEWIFGSLLAYPDGDCFICSADFDPNWLSKVEVDPDTVSQYTGLIDKNGKKIFEGDLLKFIGAGCEDEPPYLVYWKEFGWHTKSGNSRPDDMGWFSPDRWEVIGNRWDKEATP